MDANDRFIRERGQEARIAAIVEPVANDLGYDLVRVKLLPDNGLTLQIMAETPDGRFTIDDCEALSHEINPVLDVEDPIDRAYHLEVSSPGVDRPLVRPRDFARSLGHEVKIELRTLVDGRRRFRGAIAEVGDDDVTVRLPDVPEGDSPDKKIAFADIETAKLVLTDALLAAAKAAQEAENPLDDPDVETEDETQEETN